MTKADNSETLRFVGWIPPHPTNSTGTAGTTAGPDPRRPAALPPQPASVSPVTQPIPVARPVVPVAHPVPVARPTAVARPVPAVPHPADRTSRPLLVLAGATALALLGYVVTALVVLGDEPSAPPQFGLPVAPHASPAAANPPVSLQPSPPPADAVPTRSVRNTRAAETRPTRASATPSRTTTGSPAPDPAFTVGRTVGIGVTGLTGQRLRNRDFVARIEADSAATGLSGRFLVRQGLADADCLSFESAEFPGFYLRHRNFVLLVEQAEQRPLYLSDATFCPQASGTGFALRSVNYPDHHLIVTDGQVRLVRSAAAEATSFRALPPI